MISNPRDAGVNAFLIFAHISVLSLCVSSLEQTTNDRDMKFGTQTPLHDIQTLFFYEKVNLKAVRLEKL